MLHIVVWKWRQHAFREVYTAEFVNIVARMLRAHLKDVPLDIVCVTDDPVGIDYPTRTFPLWTDHDSIANATGKHLPSCYRRLKLFDQDTQQAMGFAAGDRVVSFDLDSIVLGSLVELFARIDKSECVFAGWGVRGHYHQIVFNGSFWTFKAGDNNLQKLWSAFDPLESPRTCMKKGFLGSDQAWLSMHFTQMKGVMPIGHPDFISYPREVRRTHKLHSLARVVFFHGSRKPWHPLEYRQQSWITNHWR